VTEYFARKIIGALGRPSHAPNTRPTTLAAVKLVNLVGEPAIRDAYFKGLLGPLTSVAMKSISAGLSDE
jgi:hypothetical protein